LRGHLWDWQYQGWSDQYLYWVTRGHWRVQMAVNETVETLHAMVPPLMLFYDGWVLLQKKV
jgi:hypothetical protein